MLCQTCQRRQNCLPLQLAQRDRIIRQQLAHLRRCEQRQPIAQSSAIAQLTRRMKAAARTLWGLLRRLRQAPPLGHRAS